MSKMFKCPPTDLRCYQPKERQEVMYAVSNKYNGGISIKDEWYDGFEVPPPYILPGYGIVGIGVGLELNACPPLATGVLKPVDQIAPGTLYMTIDGTWKRKEETHGQRRKTGVAEE